MSYESTDDRIERLESQVAELIEIQKVVLASEPGQKEIVAILAEFCIDLRSGLLALLKANASSPLITDEKTRQDFRERISRMESNAEKAEAMLATLKQSLENNSTKPPAPGESAPPGSPP
jgi:iron-sulfur cluster repair protein YtfE (RIC family)